MKWPNRKPPIFEGGIVRFDVSTYAHPDSWAEVDAQDWRGILAYRWSATKRPNGLYVKNATRGLLHRFLMKPEDHLVVDHRNGDTLNNRRSNLRICTQGENVTFAADRARGFAIETIIFEVATKPHVVKRTLADGTVQEYIYPSRSKKGTKRVAVCKRALQL